MGENKAKLDRDVKCGPAFAAGNAYS